jgi:trimethylamine--corrinoid protein Co-methyltransferase
MLPLYDILTSEQVTQIHESALHVLNQMGVKIEHRGALENLAEAGANVDFSNHIACFSEDMIHKALELVPKQFVCAGRSPEFDFDLGPERRLPILRSGAGCIRILDAGSNEIRPLLRGDGIDSARLNDALERVNVGCTLTLSDLPQATYDIHALKDALIHCRKHTWALILDSKNLHYQIEMMLAVAGSRQNLNERPLCSGIFSILSPMYIPHDEIERLLIYGKYHIPVRMVVLPLKGGNSPYTIAGTMTSINAQFLGALVVQQTLCPGQPTLYYAGAKSMDMRTGNAVPNLSPENQLIIAGVCQLGRHYKLPTEMSLLTFPGCQMHQYLFHLGSSILWAMTAGIQGIGSAGNFDGSNVWSPEAVILADEIVAYYEKLFAGFEINEDTLAVDAMLRVGHRGHFLSDPDTLKHLHQETSFVSSLLDYGSYDDWSKSDFETIIERAHARLEKILLKHEVPELDPDVRKELDNITNSADRKLLK